MIEIRLLDGRCVDDVLMARYAAESAANSRQSSIGSAQSGQGTL